MKKFYFISMLSLLMLSMSSCNDHDWGSAYYIEDIVGSWVAEFGTDYYGTYEIGGRDAVRYDFYSNYTGRYTCYTVFGLDYVDFDWETRGNRLFIWYYDGDAEYLYYGFDDYGYLILSPDSRFYSYTAYRPTGGYYYEPGKELSDSDAKLKAPDEDAKATTEVKSVSRALKARATEK